MRKNQARNVVVHVPEDADRRVIAGQISRFHAAVVERRLGQLACSPKQKAAILERVILEIGNRCVK